FRSLSQSPAGISRVVTLAILCMLCRCLPLYVREDCSIDMSFISMLTIVLTEGPIAAAAISFLTSPFVIIPTEDGKGYQHIFNTDPIKTLFNTANLTLTVALAGISFYLTGGRGGVLKLPDILLPMLVFILVSMAANSLLMIILFVLEQQIPFYPTVFGMFLQLLPSMLCAAPIGFFLALLMEMQSGAYLVLLFMLPLLLARYAFRLFLDMQKQQVAMINTLTAAIEAKDPYTEGHSQRVSEYAAQIAAEMRLPPKKAEQIRLAGLFHDVGKIGIPDAILQKPGRLTDAEWVSMRSHPAIGIQILQQTSYYDQVSELVLHHHETYDGKGYPDGTRADQIPLEAYILGVADAYDAMTSDRPYRRGKTPAEARRILLEEAGKQFHPDVAAAAARMIEEGRLSCPGQPAVRREQPEDAPC
ncbi:MAG: HD-GYP domain-containing protein, partial [Oscillospiraceae bacterium]|nr:HD-GYP domain-containing protein [Oscillospiraceae bacterium]